MNNENTNPIAEVETPGLLTNLHNYIASMPPHQAERMSGRLIISATKELIATRKEVEELKKFNSAIVNIDLVKREQLWREDAMRLAEYTSILNSNLEDYLQLLAGHDKTCDCERCEAWRGFNEALTAHNKLVEEGKE